MELTPDAPAKVSGETLRKAGALCEAPDAANRAETERLLRRLALNRLDADDEAKRLAALLDLGADPDLADGRMRAAAEPASILYDEPDIRDAVAMFDHLTRELRPAYEAAGAARRG